MSRELNAEGQLRKALFADTSDALSTPEVSIADKVKLMLVAAESLRESAERLQVGDYDAKLYEAAVEVRTALQSAHDAGVRFETLLKTVGFIKLNTPPMWFEPPAFLKAIVEVIEKIGKVESQLRQNVPASVVDRVAALDPKRGK